MKNRLKWTIQAAVIASIYGALTIFLTPISYGVMQVRVSEALTILPVFTSAAVPGLFIGCLIANMLGPFGFLDIVIGSLASLIAALASYKLREKKWLVPLPPVVVNGIMIGGMLYYGYHVPVSLIGCILWVSLGQLIACYGIGYPLMSYLKKYEYIFRVN